MASVCFHYFAVVSDDTAALRQTHTLNKHSHFHTNTVRVDRLLYLSSEILTYTHRCSVSVVGICLQTFSSLPELSYHVFECRDSSLRPSYTHTHCSTLKTGYNLMLRWHTQTLFDASIADLLISLERKII